jgi:RNA polymerase sigma-70 factor (ECF subfamily)
MSLADATSRGLWPAQTTIDSSTDTPREANAATSDSAPLELRALFETHHARICRLLRRFGVQPAQIDDAAQEVFWVAARRLDEIQPGRESAFLYGVAVRVASSDVRRQKADPAGADLAEVAEVIDPLPSPEDQLEQQRARVLLDVALDRLPHELRRVLVLFELEGLAVREIAAVEGVPLGTASSRLRRAREEFSAIARNIRSALGAGSRPR